jgi:hypothetical protein
MNHLRNFTKIFFVFHVRIMNHLYILYIVFLFFVFKFHFLYILYILVFRVHKMNHHHNICIVFFAIMFTYTTTSFTSLQ